MRSDKVIALFLSYRGQLFVRTILCGSATSQAQLHSFVMS